MPNAAGLSLRSKYQQLAGSDGTGNWTDTSRPSSLRTANYATDGMPTLGHTHCTISKHQYFVCGP